MRLALAQLVRALHGAILLFVLLAPLLARSVTVLILHVGLLLALLMHWVTSQHYCVLSLLESKLRGIDYEDGFLNAVLKPLFGFGVSNRLAYAVTLGLLVVSVARIHAAFTSPEEPRKCDQFRGLPAEGARP
jgi:hypothetical protein